MSLSRRHLLGLGGLAAGAALLGVSACSRAAPAQAAASPRGPFPLQLDEAQWRQRLTPAQFAVLRQHSTERAFTSPLNKEHRRGTFHCAGCAQALFASTSKFESGTGWPSFSAVLPGAVGEQRDTAFGMLRVEVHCSRCGGHLGHLFNDGPRPSGLRYCINGAAMTFTAGDGNSADGGWRVRR